MKISFHCVLYFALVAFFMIGLCLLLVLVSPDVDLVLFVLDLHIKYTVEVVPLHSYIVWFVIV